MTGADEAGAGNESDRPFTILALDGGGVRGLFSAAVLARLEADHDVRIVDHFDLIVGTSTGGIIALGLGAGMAPAEIVDLYLSGQDTIFPPARRRLYRKPAALLRARYRPTGLAAAVTGAFGDKLLCDSTVPLVVTSFDLGQRAVHLFKTPHNQGLARDWRVRMADVAMATTAAPTFFPAFELPGDHARLIDGGVWANNPSTVGVTEAVSLMGQRLENIRLLNIGTTTSTAIRSRRLDQGGLWHWIRSPNVIDVLLAGQSIGAFNQAQHLIGSHNAWRLDPPAPKELVQLDRADARDLIGAAAHHSRRFGPAFTEHFASHTRHPYSPLHTREELNR
jgi:patatin-like phospholipase/acyl hydrolase